MVTITLTTPEIVLITYGLLIFLGGLIGYLKANSKASLIAGTLSGKLFFLVFHYNVLLSRCLLFQFIYLINYLLFGVLRASSDKAIGLGTS